MGRAFAFTLPHTFVKGLSGKNYLFSSRSPPLMLLLGCLSCFDGKKYIYIENQLLLKCDSYSVHQKSVLPEVDLKRRKVAGLSFDQKSFVFYVPSFFYYFEAGVFPALSLSLSLSDKETITDQVYFYPFFYWSEI